MRFFPFSFSRWGYERHACIRTSCSMCATSPTVSARSWCMTISASPSHAGKLSASSAARAPGNRDVADDDGPAPAHLRPGVYQSAAAARYHSCGRAPALFGVLFQEGALFSSLTVLENIMLPMRETYGFDTGGMRGTGKLQIIAGRPRTGRGREIPVPTFRRDDQAGEPGAGAGPRSADPVSRRADLGLDPVSATSFDQLIATQTTTLGVTILMITHDLDSLLPFVRGWRCWSIKNHH